MSPLIVALLLAQWQPPGITVRDEGTGLGQAGIVNCTGTGVTCTLGLGGVWTLNSTAGGGTYSGVGPCGDSAWVTALNDNAAPTCSSIYFSDLVGTAALTQLEDSTTASLCLLSGGTGGDPAWASCPGGGAPTGASYWTSTAEAGLSAERNLGALTTGLVLNTVAAGVGTPSAYGGATCTLPNVVTAISASGAATCSQPTAVSGNAATATALAADPGDCTLPNLALGVNASGTAACAQPTNVTGNAATATALAADPGDCSGNNFALGVNASGTAACAQPSFNNLSGSAAIGQGGTTETASTEDAVLVGASTTDWVATVLPSCSNATTSKLLYDNTTNAFSCGTDQTGASGSGTTLQVTGSDVTNSTTTPATIFSTSVSANTQYGFHCELVAQGTATSLPRYNVNGPSSSNVAFETRRFTTTSAQTLLVLQAFSASAQTATCTSSCNATNLPIYISGVFTVGGSGGTLAFQVASSTSGQTVTVRRGSFCRVF